MTGRETIAGSSDPRHYLRLVWRHKWVLLAVVVLIPAAVYGISTRIAKTYESSTTLHVQQTTFSSSLFLDEVSISTSTASEAARLIETTPVAAEATRKLGEPPSTGRLLLEDIDVEIDTTEGTQTEFVTITAQAGSAGRAADVANAFARAVASTRTEDAVESIDETIATLTGEAGELATDPATRRALAQQLQQLRALRASQSDTTQVIDPALAESEPVSPRPVRNAALGLVFALLAAAGLVPLLDWLDRRLRDADSLEGIVGAPLLAMIPENAFPGHAPQPHVRESFQTLRAALTYFNVDRSLGSVLIASPAYAEGKTTVATNLAVALAQDGRDVILVDADLRRCQAAARLGLDAAVGLDAVLLGERDLRESLLEVDEVEGGRLRVLAAVSPPPNPAVLLGSGRMRSVLVELSEISDIVVIDTPALLIVSDAIPLLEQTSGVVLVARVDQTTRDALGKARQVIGTAGGKVLGAVATGTAAGGLYGYYGYGYRYYEAEPEDAGDGRPNGGGPLARLLRRPGRSKRN